MSSADRTSGHARSPVAVAAAALTTALLLHGCAVVSVAGAATGAAISVAGAVVSTGVTLTGKAIGKTVDAITPGDQ